MGRTFPVVSHACIPAMSNKCLSLPSSLLQVYRSFHRTYLCARRRHSDHSIVTQGRTTFNALPSRSPWHRDVDSTSNSRMVLASSRTLTGVLRRLLIETAAQLHDQSPYSILSIGHSSQLTLVDDCLESVVYDVCVVAILVAVVEASCSLSISWRLQSHVRTGHFVFEPRTLRGIVAYVYALHSSKRDLTFHPRPSGRSIANYKYPPVIPREPLIKTHGSDVRKSDGRDSTERRSGHREDSTSPSPDIG
ncbi:uncharacterized protein STEHIDRAFT_169032, partial [Stereum hirsutum FP-91666 SS1]|uniref:uncharacterized protein n=1 Tax=Stereum hirsutum (strain FP-91666) TaxID=721885 RepID=UPI0004449D62